MFENFEDFHQILRFIVLHMDIDKLLRYWPIYFYIFGQLIFRCFEIEVNKERRAVSTGVMAASLFILVTWEKMSFLFMIIFGQDQSEKYISTSSAFGHVGAEKFNNM